MPLPARASDTLPTDPEATAPLPEAYERTLDEALGGLGLSLSAGARAAIDAQARLLLAWIGSINLTALRSPRQVALEHVADSLAAVELVTATGPPDTLLDLGSGAGYPGLPLGIAAGARRVALVEATGKKARFLQAATAAATEAMEQLREAPPAFEVHARRAEELALENAHRGAWALVTARAVAPLVRLAPLALPLVAPGGVLLAWKRDDGSGSLARELAAARPTLVDFGADVRLTQVEPVKIAGLGDHRLVVMRKG